MEALRKLRDEQPKDRSDQPTPALDEAVRWWLADQKSRLREKTYTNYEGTLRLHVLEAYPALALMRVDRIKPAHLRELFDKLADRSPRVRELVFLRLHSLFASMVGEYIAKNPVMPAMKNRVPRKTMDTWTADEARAFLEATKDDWLAVLYRLALSVGMRKGELLGLRWVDVDLKGKRLHIQHTLGDDGTLGEPKTAGSRRTIELPQKSIDGLIRQKSLLMGAGLRASPWVFPDRDGGPYLTRKLSRDFDAAITAAKMRRIRFHDLRHTAATLRLQLGEHPKLVSEMLGHAKFSITMDLYSHATPSMQRDSADRFDGVL